MDRTIQVSKYLTIELLPGTDNSDPALRIFTNHDPELCFVVFLSEIHLLRDGLIEAGARLTELETEARRQRS